MVLLLSNRNEVGLLEFKWNDKKFKVTYYSQPIEHDFNSCEAYGKFLKLHKATISDFKRIAEEHETTIEEMKEHKDCWKTIYFR